MLLLSRITGQVVRGPDGQAIGRLVDLTADLVEESGPHLVDRVVVAPRRGRRLVIPWEQVATFDHGRLVLACAAPDAVDDLTATLGEREILLARDVLDTQVVDVVGQRLARVADVVLARTPEGRLELIGVEVGFAGVLRRLGLPTLERSRADMVAWTDLHLASERGHSVQLATPRSAVNRLGARELAGLLSRLDTESAAEILAVKGPSIAAEVVRAAHPAVGERVLRAMPEPEAARIVAAMPAEHASRWRYVLQHAPVLLGRRFLRFRVWPRRQHTIGPS
ncbi:magnesium transporter [Mycolicibacterium sp. CH28]|uniref:magnesium transporter MgtE N-terminal domain-containing protein n=1 Tax=Mycolicibacterium sp. CH28 TaxID=2512237 RepID=UPI001081F156|nr:magnesium transporter [Mycolicibacterium sp. CH28]TGD89989.1 magnesium transporter [Mycolicibacterium sp. CH28]